MTSARRHGGGCRFDASVMPGLVPGIHVLLMGEKASMAGSSPAMTLKRDL